MSNTIVIHKDGGHRVFRVSKVYDLGIDRPQVLLIEPDPAWINRPGACQTCMRTFQQTEAMDLLCSACENRP